mmetsp:Transcript_10684/g.39931  ORF Transcript_10684/g.39931 Transcript_10684/m.39931 type:complete len:221 (-) Transcript_10684:4377-5039(-)
MLLAQVQQLTPTPLLRRRRGVRFQHLFSPTHSLHLSTIITPEQPLAMHRIRVKRCIHRLPQQLQARRLTNSLPQLTASLHPHHRLQEQFHLLVPASIHTNPPAPTHPSFPRRSLNPSQTARAPPLCTINSIPYININTEPHHTLESSIPDLSLNISPTQNFFVNVLFYHLFASILGTDFGIWSRNTKRRENASRSRQKLIQRIRISAITRMVISWSIQEI